MANIENLRPSEYKLSQEEAKRGGIRSGEVRREKATMKKTLEMLLNDTNKKGVSYKELATLGLIKGAIDGKSDNYKTILQVLGELQDNNTTTPEVNINIIDNSDLEKVMYEKK